MQKVDLVYVLGSGSIWNNNELRFSLRSVQKNLRGVRKVYIVGEDPGFLTGEAIHIPHPDPLRRNADGNMALKILRACEERGLTDDFLFMNDDFIINQPMVAGEIPWMHKGDMKGRSEKFWKAQFYHYRLRRTYDVLSGRFLPTIQYDYHAPMLMNKHRFPKVMAQFNFTEDIGYTFRSLYGNCLELPAIPVKGNKITIYRYYTFQQIQQRVENIPFVGYNDQGLNRSLKWWLMDNFSEKSKYENNLPQDKITDLWQWFNRGQNYDMGVQIFEKYYKHKNLLRLLKMGESKMLRKKLEFKFTQTIKEL